MFASLAATSTNYDWINKTNNRIKNLKTGKQNSKRKKKNLNRTKDNKKIQDANKKLKTKTKIENRSKKKTKQNKQKKQAEPLNSKLTKLAIHSPRLYWLKLNGKKTEIFLIWRCCIMIFSYRYTSIRYSLPLRQSNFCGRHLAHKWTKGVLIADVRGIISPIPLSFHSFPLVFKPLPRRLLVNSILTLYTSKYTLA